LKVPTTLINTVSLPQDNALTLKLVTGSNVGTRSYLLADDNTYYMFKLKNQEFTFDVDLSAVGCGLNAALYFVQMDEDGGMSKYPGNKAGAKYGTGYCDAQCAKCPKFINGEVRLVTLTILENNII
jgi:cellulose 1,4-beta-cellobiosidase